MPVTFRLIRFVASRVRFPLAGFWMTDRTDVARARDIVARWCGLAEQRLDYLTELFESGRWRRYYSEHDFLDNIREAKSAVEAWRAMLSSEAMPDNRPLDLSWIGRRSPVPSAQREVPEEPMPVVTSQLAELPVAPAASVVPEFAEPEPEPVLTSEPVVVSEAAEPPSESALDRTLALTLDIVASAERYPLLRNAFQQ